jgi:rare lipoprotein A (peptidoglycan hydrolase)
MAKKGVVGVASWYDYSLNGIEWSKDHETCATRDFKRYSTIRVTNLKNGKSVDCYVNDYGPELGQIPERHVDLSSHAFSQIADLNLGLINVKIEEL